MWRNLERRLSDLSDYEARWRPPSLGGDYVSGVDRLGRAEHTTVARLELWAEDWRACEAGGSWVDALILLETGLRREASSLLPPVCPSLNVLQPHPRQRSDRAHDAPPDAELPP